MVVDIEVVDANKPSPRILNRAAHLISKGKVIVCPTDTGYALAANALDARAVLKVFSLKGRAYSNPIHIAVSSMEAAEKYARLNKTAEHLAHSFLPGALTLVLPRKEIIPSLLVAGLDTIGIRIPDNRVILDLAVMTNLPITATSANLSGQPTPYSAKEVAEQLGETIKNVALILDQGPLPVHGLSTIVDLTVSPPQLIRQGRVSWLEIWQVLQSLPDLG
ncbi:MAG TPA: L-threonylcarbamoyladenylate synthase [Dehalococcoidales bacterium]|nr:L-threonylcarbamoyladenylate synthase [Dehalococcoidales bacterium]